MIDNHLLHICQCVDDIKQVNFTKYLGIYIDQHLSWDPHIDYLSKKIARNVGILSKLKHFLPMYIMNTLYYSYNLISFTVLYIDMG